MTKKRLLSSLHVIAGEQNERSNLIKVIPCVRRKLWNLSGLNQRNEILQIGGEMKKIFVIAVLGLSFIGCGKKEEVKMKMDKQEMEHQHEKMQHGMEMKETGKEMGGVIIRKARKDELGKSVVCPVMGTKFNVGQNTEAADYKGKSYYFCCGGCPPAFKNNPEKYITK